MLGFCQICSGTCVGCGFPSRTTQGNPSLGVPVAPCPGLLQIGTEGHRYPGPVPRTADAHADLGNRLASPDLAVAVGGVVLQSSEGCRRVLAGRVIGCTGRESDEGSTCSALTTPLDGSPGPAMMPLLADVGARSHGLPGRFRRGCGSGDGLPTGPHPILEVRPWMTKGVTGRAQPVTLRQLPEVPKAFCPAPALTSVTSVTPLAAVAPSIGPESITISCLVRSYRRGDP